jgi:catechol 2,3-dioxygenase-like lactoylglutathione lyase family enzyme
MTVTIAATGEERPMAESPETTPIKVKKLGHVVFTVADIERTTRFWTEIMGFHVSDRNERGMVFLRNASDHHTIALVPAETPSAVPREGQPGFHHCALEVGAVSELFAIRDFLRAKGVPIVYEGRRGPGGNPGVEFEDPDGFHIELYASMDQIGADGKSRPAEQWRRAKTLEEAVANPLPGVSYR